jgi:hypothetical protein
MTPQKLEKLKKTLSDTVIEELDALDETGLKKAVSDSTEAIETATRERNDNPKYQTAKLAVTDLSGALKDTKKYQKAKITYSIYRLRELRGEEE